MSTASATAEQTENKEANWLAGAIGGIIGAFIMGLFVIVMNSAVLAVAIPSLYMLAPPPNLPLGGLVHLFHGAVLGLVFVAIVERLDLGTAGKVVGAGIGWGVATWVVLAGLVMPLWLSAVGSPASPPFPNFAPPSLLWHLVYGIVLGGVYVGLKPRL